MGEENTDVDTYRSKMLYEEYFKRGFPAACWERRTLGMPFRALVPELCHGSQAAGAIQPQLTLTSAAIPMQAKHSSTRDMLGADGGTTMSLCSRASTTSHHPECGGTEHWPPSSVWCPVALTLLLLFLVLLIGLAVLGVVFFQFYQLSDIQTDSFSKMEERLGNLSQQRENVPKL